MSHTLLCIDDDPLFLNGINLVLIKHYQVFLCQNFETAKIVLEDKDIDLVLLDIDLGNENGIEVLKTIKANHPKVEVMMLSGDRNPRQIVECMKLGACDYITKDTDIAEMLSCIDQILIYKHTKDRLDSLIADGNQNYNQNTFIGSSSETKTLLSKADRVKGLDVSVLIQGEQGTGKEVLARYIHNLENNERRPFITFNCAEVMERDIESIFFGHENSSSGQAFGRRHGKCELADGGDLFLDNIDALNLDLQEKLLRVLEQQEVFRTGSVKSIRVHFRCLAATNKNLSSLVRNKTFREDLYLRLSAIKLNILPLRERWDDLKELVDHFLEKHCEKSGCDNRKQLSTGAFEALKDYDWPGNVHQLENLIHSLVIMTRSHTIDLKDFPLSIARAKLLKDKHFLTLTDIDGETYNLNFNAPKLSLPKIRRLFEREYINRMIEANSGNKSLAAKQIGLTRAAMYHIIGVGNKV